MKVIESLDQLPVVSKPPNSPIAIVSIGNFDGVHLGHQKVIKKLVEEAKQTSLKPVLITFKNHPATVLHKEFKIPLLTNFTHKIKLIETLGLNEVIALPFTKEFSKQTAEQFLRSVYLHTPFKSVILGFDAKIGHDRLGDTYELQQVADKMNFKLEFLPPEIYEDAPISSSRIRRAIQEANFSLAEALLGRPYSIIVSVPSLSESSDPEVLLISPESRALPPPGIYIVKILFQHHHYPGVLTISSDPEAPLEIELSNQEINLFGKEIEIVFENNLK